MNVVINIDKNYVGIASIMLFSLLSNNKEFVTLFIFNDDLEECDFESIKNTLKDFNNIKIVDVKIDSSMFPLDTSVLTNRWGKAVFYRLLISEFLPETVERALYMDTDIIVDKSLKEMYNIDLNNNYIAACIDTEVSDLYDNDRLHINDANVYFNSGIILFDVKRIKTDGIMSIQVINECLKKYSNKLLFPDQDLLNILFAGKTLIMEHRKYNFLCARSRHTNRLLRMYGRKAAIFHYGGETWHRPWNYNYVGKFGDKFWSYAVNTPYGKEISKSRTINKILKPLFIIWFDLRLIYIKAKSKLGW